MLRRTLTRLGGKASHSAADHGSGGSPSKALPLPHHDDKPPTQSLLAGAVSTITSTVFSPFSNSKKAKAVWWRSGDPRIHSLYPSRADHRASGFFGDADGVAYNPMHPLHPPAVLIMVTFMFVWFGGTEWCHDLPYFREWQP